MSRVKKVVVGIGVFISRLATKVFAVDMLLPISMYAVDPGPRQTIGNTISKIGKIAIPVVLFVIGLIVILNKKIAKKVKAIVALILVILTILGVVLMNYLSTII